MATITTRTGKGTPLTNAELDANFTNLNADKLESDTGAQLLAAITQAIDLASEAAGEIVGSGLTNPTSMLEVLARSITALHDLAGVTAKAIAGGDITLRRGTVADPSLHMADDPTTGMWSPGANALAFSVGGIQGMRLTSDRRLGLGDNNNTPTGVLDVSDNKIRVRTAQTPATTGAAGNQGDIAWDANYLYVCTATNTWKRVAIATW